MESHPIRLLLLGVMLALSFPHAALSQFSLRVEAPTSVLVSNNIPYTIRVRSDGQGMAPLEVTSVYSPSLEFVSATETNGISFTRENSTVRFVIQQLFPGSNVVLNLTLRAPQIAKVTNNISASFGGQLLQRTNVVTDVAQAPGTADAAVFIISPAPVYVNDWASFTVRLLNLGGGTVSGIFLTNTFNAPVLVRDFRPSAGASVLQNPTRVVFNIGSLPAGQSTNCHITIQPTAATNVVLRSNFRFSGNMDTNAVNNTNTATLVVQPNGATNTLVARIASDQQFNPQNSLIEQLITVENVGTNVAPNARVIISNATLRVVNAVGTNSGHPFVLHAASIQPTQTVELLLEYFSPDGRPRANPTPFAYSTTEGAPPARTNGTFTEISQLGWREPFGAMTETNLVLFFRSEPGALYEVQYSPTIEFTNALRALPSIRAPANFTVWIDYGPPKTISRPLREITFMTNAVPNLVVSTNESYVTNDTGIVTNRMTATNLVGFTTNYVTNLNMRFYRAMKLP